MAGKGAGEEEKLLFPFTLKDSHCSFDLHHTAKEARSSPHPP